MATEFTTANDGDFISANAGVNAATEQSLLLEVADFDKADSMTSYLRLGAVESALVTSYQSLYHASGDNQYTPNANAVSPFTAGDPRGEDLASQVLSFVDDERDRGTVGTDTFALNSVAQRREMSYALHTRGGWRDHTDGNRVTTTRGDKVEVIGGNYKLLVLGRSQWTTNDDGSANGVGLNHESSGGITYHYDEVPGQIIDVRWVSDPYSGTWKVLERCDKGHVIELFQGNEKEWMRGGDVVTRVGSMNAYDNAFGTSGGAEDNFNASDDADFTEPTNASHPSSFTWPYDDRLPNITEHTFASSVTDIDIAYEVYEQVGSATRPVSLVEEKTFATTVTEQVGSTSKRVGSLTTTRHAKKIDEEAYFGSYTLTATAKSPWKDWAQEKWSGGYGEAFFGAAMSAKIGGFIDYRWGLKIVETNISYPGPMLGLNIAVRNSTLEAMISKYDFLAVGDAYELKLCANYTDVNRGEVEWKLSKWTAAGVILFF